MKSAVSKGMPSTHVSFKIWTANKDMTKKPRLLVKEMEDTFKASANKVKAEQMKKYMRNQFEFFGVTAPERRSLSKKFMTAALSQGELYALAAICWEKTQREFQLFGYELLEKRPELLLPRSAQYDPMELVKALVVTKSWWDTVDMLACKVLGHLAVADKDHTLSVLEDWIHSGNMWLKRCAILYQLSYKKKTDQQKLFRYCLLCCSHKDFFIQKAIGWALREYAKTSPKEVQKFVNANKKKLAPLSVREALKHFK